MAWKFHAFVGYSSDVVNKARLYDNSMRKPEVALAPKVIQCLVDYSGKIEKPLKELQALLQLGEQREEARPSERHPEPEPAGRRAPPLVATSPISPPTPAAQPEAVETQPEALASTPGMVDPTFQEPIP